MSVANLVPEIAASSQAWRDAIERMAVTDKPGFFQLMAQLPEKGRTNQVFAATKRMNVVLKTYSTGGENELHAHSNEDHLFIILQGSATFYGPAGEERTVKKNGGVILPKGVLYRFIAHEDEPLVLLRVGAVIDEAQDPLARLDEWGAPFDGYGERNKEQPNVLSLDRWFV